MLILLQVYHFLNECYIRREGRVESEGTRKYCFFLKEGTKQTRNTEKMQVRQNKIKKKLEQVKQDKITLAIELERPTVLLNEVLSTEYVIRKFRRA